MFTMLTAKGRSTLALGVLLWLAAARLGAAINTPWFARSWQTDDGLPDNAVVGIAQTPDGFLWVATQGGLVRFDGIQFRDFAPVTAAGTPSGLLHGLTVDRHGRLWLTKDGGVVACVDQGRATSFTLRKSSNTVRAATPVEDGEGNLWAAYPTEAGRLVQIRDGQVRYFGADHGLPSSGIFQVVADVHGRLWCAAGESVGLFHRDRFVVSETVKGLNCIAAARSGGLWVCSGSKVLKLTEEGGAMVVGELPVARQNNVTATIILEDHAGRLWVGTSKQGLFRREGESFVAVPVSHREILSLTEDREDNIWVGTRGGGLNRLRPSVVESQEIASGLPFEAVRSVCQDRDGTLWAVARSGVVARQQGSGWSALTVTNGWNIEDAMAVALGDNALPGKRCVSVDQQCQRGERSFRLDVVLNGSHNAEHDWVDCFKVARVGGQFEAD